MTTLNITPKWNPTINQIEKSETALGGADGNINKAPKQLAENIFFLKEKLDNVSVDAYKKGDIYMTTLSHADTDAVNKHHGYGTWVRFAEGRALVGFSTTAGDDARYQKMGNEFGENTHQLIDAEMPVHKHSKTDILNKFSATASDIKNTKYDKNTQYGVSVADADDGNISSEYFVSDVSDVAWADATEQEIGNDEPHNNIQPSIVVAYWLRTA